MRWRSGRPSAAAVALAALLVAAALGCTGEGSATGVARLRIGAAADLRFALEEVLARFREAHPGVDAQASYGSSGTLLAQIENGAPFDVYLSADLAYAERLASAGLAERAFAYGVGRLVVWAPAGSGLPVERLGMRALVDPSVRAVAIANPEHAPYGRAAVAAMRSLGVYGEVRNRLVLGESVAQAMQLVESGAADVGVVALALALAPGADGRRWEVPADAHPEILQGGAVLHRAADPGLARAFVRFLLSPTGRAILERYGFEAPG